MLENDPWASLGPAEKPQQLSLDNSLVPTPNDPWASLGPPEESKAKAPAKEDPWAVLDKTPEPEELSYAQRVAKALGFEVSPRKDYREAPKGVVELPPEAQRAMQIQRDVKSGVKFESGLDKNNAPDGQYPAKIATRQELEHPYSKAIDDWVDDHTSNPIIHLAAGLLTHGRESAGNVAEGLISLGPIAYNYVKKLKQDNDLVLESRAQYRLDAFDATTPNALGSRDREELVKAVEESKTAADAVRTARNLSPEEKKRLVALGADESIQTGALNADEYAKTIAKGIITGTQSLLGWEPHAEDANRSIPSLLADSIPYHKALGIGDPNREWSLDWMNQQIKKDPINAILTIDAAAALPRSLARGASRGAMKAAEGLDAAGLGKAAEIPAEGGAAAASVEGAPVAIPSPTPVEKAADAARKLNAIAEAVGTIHPEQVLSALTSAARENAGKVPVLGPVAERMIESADQAKGFAKIRNRGEDSIQGPLSMKSGDLADLYKKITPEELKTVEDIAEGRTIRPPDLSKPAADLLDYTSKLDREVEVPRLIKNEKYTPEGIESRRWAPRATEVFERDTGTFKRTPDSSWSPEDITTENTRIDELNQRAGKIVESPYMTGDEFARSLLKAKDEWKAKAEAAGVSLADAEKDIHYVPRFEARLTENGTPAGPQRTGRLPIEKRYTGKSVLNTDLPDPAASLAARQQALASYARFNQAIELVDRVAKEYGTSVAVEDGARLSIPEGHVLFPVEAVKTALRTQEVYGRKLASEGANILDVGQSAVKAARDLIEQYKKAEFKDLPVGELPEGVVALPYRIANKLSGEFGEKGKFEEGLNRVRSKWVAGTLHPLNTPFQNIYNMITNAQIAALAPGGVGSLLRTAKDAVVGMAKEDKALLPEHLQGPQGFATGMGIKVERPVEAFTKPFRELGKKYWTDVAEDVEAANSSPGILRQGMDIIHAPFSSLWQGFKSLQYTANQAGDMLIKRRLYVDGIKDAARQELMIKGGTEFVRADAVMQEVMHQATDPGLIEKHLDGLDKFTLNFNNMTPFERNKMRLISPFWSFTREATRLAFTLPFSSPIKTAMAARVGAAMLDANEKEVMGYMGFHKEQMPEWLQGRVVWRADGDHLLFFNPNPTSFLGGLVAVPLVALNNYPFITKVLELAMGKKNYGTWGAWQDWNKYYDGEQQGGSLKGYGNGIMWNALRVNPLFERAEDFAQFLTSPKHTINEIHDDVTPLSNLIQFLGGEGENYDLPNKDRTGPKRERSLWETISPIKGYQMSQVMEQRLKDKEKELNAYIGHNVLSDERKRGVLDRNIKENLGKPYEKLADFYREEQKVSEPRRAIPPPVGR